MRQALCTRLVVALALAAAGLLPVADAVSADHRSARTTVVASPSDDNGWW
ncbi:hypothetical protein [Streptomyces roseolus]